MFKFKVSKKMFLTLEAVLVGAIVLIASVSLYQHKIELAAWQVLNALVVFFYLNLNRFTSASLEFAKESQTMIHRLSTHNREVEQMVQQLSAAPIGVKGIMVFENDHHEMMTFDVIKTDQKKMNQKSIAVA
jgi:hypothetical protein